MTDTEKFRLRHFVEKLVQQGECVVHDDPIDLIDVAFEHQFGVGRYADIDGDAFHDRHRRAAHGTDHVELVHRRRRRPVSRAGPSWA